MSDYKKYCADDLKAVPSFNPAISKAIGILERYPETGDSYRQKIANKLREIGLLALSDHLLRLDNYEAFLCKAKEEQAERLKNRTPEMIEQYPYNILEEKLQTAKRLYSDCENKYVSDFQIMSKRHCREIVSLKSEHEKQIKNLEKRKKIDQDRLRQEIKNIEHKIKLQSDPQYAAAYYAEQKRKQEEKEQREAENHFLQSYGLHLTPIAPEDRNILFSILRKLQLDERLSEEDSIWLQTDDGKKYFLKDSEIYRKYHYLEAEFFSDLFKQKKNIWNAVNASSHFRKARLSSCAKQLLENISENRLSDKKLKSAFLTTLGGVKRDLGEFQDGIEKAKIAHELSPKDYRPCTLLGALYFEISEYDNGSQWFEKAERLGASKKNTDAEIKALYAKANKESKAKLQSYLLKQDPKRYAWLK